MTKGIQATGEGPESIVPEGVNTTATTVATSLAKREFPEELKAGS